jgi:hypothetical protein
VEGDVGTEPVCTSQDRHGAGISNGKAVVPSTRAPT